MGKNNIWTIGGQLFNGYISQMDYEQIEDLFSVHKVSLAGKDEPDGAGVTEKKKKENAEVRNLVTPMLPCSDHYSETTNKYSKTFVKRQIKNRQNKDLNDKW